MDDNSANPIFSKNWGNNELSGLIEVTPPADISWYPQTIGWLILLFAFSLWVLYLLYHKYQKYISNTYRRKALIELNKLIVKPDMHDAIPVLLKRTALYAYRRKQVASLTNSDWEVWLDEQCEQCRFSTTHNSQLSLLAYGHHHDLSKQTIDDLYQQIAIWIRFHKGEK